MAQWLPWRKKKTEPSTLVATSPETEEDIVEPLQEQEELDRNGASPEELVLQPLAQTSRQSLWRRGLSRLRRVFLGPIDRLFRDRPFSEEVLVELEEALITADVGVQTSTALVERLRERCRKERPESAETLKIYLKEELLTLLEKAPSLPLSPREAKPWVLLMVGVHGEGKTTTIANLTARFLH